MTSTSYVQEEKHKQNETKVGKEYTIRGFKIKIEYKEGTLFYRALPEIDLNQEPLLFAELSSLIKNNQNRLGKEILKFDELVDTVKSICMWKILEISNLNIDPEIFAELFIYRLIKIDRIIPFLIDDNINEIYMDQKGSPIYLDHQTFGRCNTPTVLEEEELKALLTRIKLEHPITISSKKPSLKVEFQTRLFHSRISMDFPPLSPNGPTFNIRKLKRKPLRLVDLINLSTLPTAVLVDLINLSTLPTAVASYLIEAIQSRLNLTVIGEPNAGKTTLANALDLYTPKHWRKIAIEDAIESINQAPMGYKQLSIQVDSFESNKSIHTKTTEILKLLHRSPDWIYLGEIQSREHTQAMFEALNAGLKGIQTAHADSAEKILRRWENLHKISRTDFLSLNILVVMKREITQSTFIRKILEIYEVDPSSNTTEGYGFLKKIYDCEMNEKQTFDLIKKNSILKDKLVEIMKRKEMLDNICNESWRQGE
ncbi:MAG: ATPase, T2SS/T4P/T4SS family [Candidatus Heimdallarchaeaceae archaeon]